MEDYFGYSSLEAARAGLGDELADLLWNTSVTWGDVIRYDDGDVIIALLADSNSRGRGVQRYRGGFFGVTGAKSGHEVSRDELKKSSVTLNGELTNRLRSAGYYQSLYVDKDSSFDYASTTVQIGRETIGIAVGAIGLAALVVALLATSPAIVAAAGIIGAGATLVGGGIAIMAIVDNYRGTSQNRNTIRYPVLRYYDPVNNLGGSGTMFTFTRPLAY
jgi:hypothetical protein